MDRPKHAIYLHFKIVNVRRSLALVSCCALLLYLYKRDFLIHFPSYHIQTGDLPVPGPILSDPPGYRAAVKRAVRNGNNNCCYRQTLLSAQRRFNRELFKHVFLLLTWLTDRAIVQHV